MKPKLLFVIPELDKQTSGHYWHIYELLQKVGKKIDVVVFAETGKNLPETRRLKLIYVQKYRFLPLRILERAVFFTNYSLRGYKYFYIHQSIFSSILTASLGKILRHKTFFWHCGKIHLYEREWGRKSWQFRVNLKLIDYLVTGNQGMKHYYHRHFAVPREKIRVLPVSVNVERFQRVDGKKIEMLRNKLKLNGKKIVLFAHWLSPRKGSRFLPEIMERTLAKETQAVFVIVGDGPDKDWLSGQIREKGLESSVRLIGAVPHRLMPLYYQLSGVFIMPSREEEIGRVQLESLATGLPVVAFRTLGSEALLAGKLKRLIVKKYDVERFSQKIIWVLRNTSCLSTLSLKRALDFRMEKAAQILVKILV